MLLPGDAGMIIAPIWRRAVAFYIDLMIAELPFCVLLMYIYAGMGVPSKPMPPLIPGIDSQVALWILLISSILFAIAYLIIPHALWGRTLGKALMRIKVIKSNGLPCDWKAAAIRAIALVLDSFAGGLVGIIFILFSVNGQRLGDRWAGTIVIRKPH
jgi:uncharacterized RDD family membrane protein YckC